MSKEELSADASSVLALSLDLAQGVGVSVVDDDDCGRRREQVFLSLRGIAASCALAADSYAQIDFRIGHLQVVAIPCLVFSLGG